MVKILHFADAHIDMANYGRHDPQTGLPLRVLDFLKSLDEIVDQAISQKVDLVIFAGDAYKDRNPAPTFQREWGKRIMRLSRANIPTILLVGNHDSSPATGRANTLDPFQTLEVPNVRVIDKPQFLKPSDLWGEPLQIIALPWIPRSSLIANLDLSGVDLKNIHEQIENRIIKLVQDWLEQADPQLPCILTAHASVQGAKLGAERSIMLGNDFTLSGSLVRDPRLDYVALGHIHLSQNLNENNHPPVIYPGSIERVDFSEAKDKKYYVIAEIDRGKTVVHWHELSAIRPFINLACKLKDANEFEKIIFETLPPPEKLSDAIVRLVIEYPLDAEASINENAIRQYASGAFEFQLIKNPTRVNRSRIPDDLMLNDLPPSELLKVYLRTKNNSENEIRPLLQLAEEIFHTTDEEE
ncbi:MAG: metallophosphoesterase family protein [Anaerolineales bacterium]